jgi:hypothetical protein
VVQDQRDAGERQGPPHERVGADLDVQQVGPVLLRCRRGQAAGGDPDTDRDPYPPKRGGRQSGSPKGNGAKGHPMPTNGGGANLRNYWLLGPQPSSLEHYAGFPPELPKRCILAGSRRGDTVLDPFLGSGTTLMVASRLGRDGIGIELKPEYATMAEGKIQRDAGALFPEDVQVTATRQPSLFDEQEAV